MTGISYHGGGRYMRVEQLDGKAVWFHMDHPYGIYDAKHCGRPSSYTISFFDNLDLQNTRRRRRMVAFRWAALLAVAVLASWVLA